MVEQVSAFDRRELVRGAALLPVAVISGGATGALATCSSSGIQIDPNVLVAINNAVVASCNFIPAITTIIPLVNAAFPAVVGATTVAQTVIEQIAALLCAHVTQAGKLGGSLTAGGSEIPVHGWTVVNGKLTYA
jgi:hypothetical protein